MTDFYEQYDQMHKLPPCPECSESASGFCARHSAKQSPLEAAAYDVIQGHIAKIMDKQNAETEYLCAAYLRATGKSPDEVELCTQHLPDGFRIWVQAKPTPPASEDAEELAEAYAADYNSDTQNAETWVRDAFLAGRASRDAEVAGLKTYVSELRFIGQSHEGTIKNLGAERDKLKADVAELVRDIEYDLCNPGCIHSAAGSAQDNANKIESIEALLARFKQGSK